MSSILLTPTSGNAAQLPIQTSGTIVHETFVPPYAAGSETFTKQGTDVDYTKWTGGATQGQGEIGDSFIGNNQGAKVDLSAKIPSYITTKFIGISFWMKIQPNSNPNIIKLLYGSVGSSANIPIELKNQSGDLWLTTRSDLGSGASGSIVTGVTHVFQGVTSKLTNWTHIFAWVNYNTGAPVLNVSVNGITLTPSTIYPGQLPSTDFNQTPATVFEVGGAGVIKGEVANLHWSTNPLFASELYTYYNQPKEYKLFERPSFTQRELFTKDVSGLGNDVNATKWKNGIEQTSGPVGLAAKPTRVAPGPDPFPYIDISDSVPLKTDGERFVGVSFFYKINSEHLANNLLFLVNDITAVNSGLSFVAWPATPTIVGAHIIASFGEFGSDLAITSSDYNNIAVIPGQWQHLFYYCDLDEMVADPTATPQIYIDGVSNTQYKSQNLVDWPANGFPSFKRGYTHSTLYNVATDSPIIGDSSVSISNLYMTNNPDFKNHLDKYKNLPKVEIK